MASMGRARGAVDAVGGSACGAGDEAVACAGGASLAATGGESCIDVAPARAGGAAEGAVPPAAFMIARTDARSIMDCSGSVLRN